MPQHLTGENIAQLQPREGGPMITAGRGVILGTLFYGGLLAIFIYLLGQLLPIVYVFVSEGL